MDSHCGWYGEWGHSMSSPCARQGACISRGDPGERSDGWWPTRNRFQGERVGQPDEALIGGKERCPWLCIGSNNYNWWLEIGGSSTRRKPVQPVAGVDQNDCQGE